MPKSHWPRGATIRPAGFATPCVPRAVSDSSRHQAETRPCKPAFQNRLEKASRKIARWRSVVYAFAMQLQPRAANKTLPNDGLASVLAFSCAPAAAAASASAAAAVSETTRSWTSLERTRQTKGKEPSERAKRTRQCSAGERSSRLRVLLTPFQ